MSNSNTKDSTEQDMQVSANQGFSELKAELNHLRETVPKVKFMNSDDSNDLQFEPSKDSITNLQIPVEEEKRASPILKVKG